MLQQVLVTQGQLLKMALLNGRMLRHIKGVLFKRQLLHRAAPDMQKALIHGIGALQQAALLG